LGNLVGEIWKMFAIQPIINVLLVLSHYLFNNFGLAIIALTIISKAVLYPINMKQLRVTRAMQEIQPRIAELQRKYSRDRQRFAREQTALYKEVGMSPIGCAVPLLIQLPIMIALYQAISRILATFPDDFLALSQYLYPLPVIYSRLPPPSGFLWLNLSVPDRFFILPILTGVSMWIQQKQITTPAMDPQQASQQKIMLWTMPLVFTYITLTFPSGLALYWVLSSVISIGMQYFVAGWGGLSDLKNMKLRLPWGGSGEKKPVKRTPKAAPSSIPTSTAVEIVNPETSAEIKEESVTSAEEPEKTGGAVKRSTPKGAPAPRRNPRKYKSRHPKGR